VLGAGLVSLILLTSIAEAATYPAEPLPTTEIRSGNALVGKGRWFSLDVYCDAPAGSVCSGSISVMAAGIRPGFAHTVPLAFRHDYQLLAGSERPLALRLSSFAAAGMERSGRLEAVVMVNVRYGYPARRTVLLRRAPRRRS
jgi:hypothetical protein